MYFWKHDTNRYVHHNVTDSIILICVNSNWVFAYSVRSTYGWYIDLVFYKNIYLYVFLNRTFMCFNILVSLKLYINAEFKKINKLFINICYYISANPI